MKPSQIIELANPFIEEEAILAESIVRPDTREGGTRIGQRRLVI